MSGGEAVLWCSDYNKVVDNSLMYLVLNFHSHRSYGLRIMAIRILLSEILALWIDLND